MREAGAKKLKVGDRVIFEDNMPNDDNGCLGTVIDRDYARFMVKWDDGVECSFPHTLAMTIQRAPSGDRARKAGLIGGKANEP